MKPQLPIASNLYRKTGSIDSPGGRGVRLLASTFLAIALCCLVASPGQSRESSPESPGNADATRSAVGQPPKKAKHGEFLGIQPGFPSDLKKYDGIIGKIETFNVRWVRMYWNWSWVEGKKGVRYLEPIKIAVNAAHKRGMKIIVLASGTPSWANGGKPQDFPPADANIPDYANYAAAIAAQTDADAIEVWNEPNNAGFWTSGPDPVKMARMQVATYRAIKAVKPKTIVITGGLTQVYAAPQTFFEKMIAADADFVKSFDAVGLHPYNEPTDPLQPGSSGMKNIITVQTPAIHQMLVKQGRGDVPFWFTEYGVATHGQWSVDESSQASYLSHFFDGLATLRGKGIKVGVCIIYTLQDTRDYQGTDDQPFFGLMRHDGTEKAAAATVRQYANSTD
jgi:polysaccharide biosynthesis protein PslG